MTSSLSPSFFISPRYSKHRKEGRKCYYYTAQSKQDIKRERGGKKKSSSFHFLFPLLIFPFPLPPQSLLLHSSLPPSRRDSGHDDFLPISFTAASLPLFSFCRPTLHPPTLSPQIPSWLPLFWVYLLPLFRNLLFLSSLVLLSFFAEEIGRHLPRSVWVEGVGDYCWRRRGNNLLFARCSLMAVLAFSLHPLGRGKKIGSRDASFFIYVD